MEPPRAPRPSMPAAARNRWLNWPGSTRGKFAPETTRSLMNFDYTPKVQDLRDWLTAFFDEHIYPNEHVFTAEIAANRANGNAWIPTAIIETLKENARAAGLWNLFLPASTRGAGLTNLEYAPLCEIMGRVPWAP